MSIPLKIYFPDFDTTKTLMFDPLFTVQETVSYIYSRTPFIEETDGVNYELFAPKAPHRAKARFLPREDILGSCKLSNLETLHFKRARRDENGDIVEEDDSNENDGKSLHFVSSLKDLDVSIPHLTTTFSDANLKKGSSSGEHAFILEVTQGDKRWSVSRVITEFAELADDLFSQFPEESFKLPQKATKRTMKRWIQLIMDKPHLIENKKLRDFLEIELYENEPKDDDEKEKVRVQFVESQVIPESEIGQGEFDVSEKTGLPDVGDVILVVPSEELDDDMVTINYFFRLTSQIMEGVTWTVVHNYKEVQELYNDVHTVFGQKFELVYLHPEGKGIGDSPALLKMMRTNLQKCLQRMLSYPEIRMYQPVYDFFGFESLEYLEGESKMNEVLESFSVIVSPGRLDENSADVLFKIFVSDGATSWAIEQTYTEFEKLNHIISNLVGAQVELPELKGFDDNVFVLIGKELQAYLTMLLRTPGTDQCAPFLQFLHIPYEEDFDGGDITPEEEVNIDRINELVDESATMGQDEMEQEIMRLAEIEREKREKEIESHKQEQEKMESEMRSTMERYERLDSPVSTGDDEMQNKADDFEIQGSEEGQGEATGVSAVSEKKEAAESEGKASPGPVADASSASSAKEGETEGVVADSEGAGEKEVFKPKPEEQRKLVDADSSSDNQSRSDSPTARAQQDLEKERRSRYTRTDSYSSLDEMPNESLSIEILSQSFSSSESKGKRQKVDLPLYSIKSRIEDREFLVEHKYKDFQDFDEKIKEEYKGKSVKIPPFPKVTKTEGLSPAVVRIHRRNMGLYLQGFMSNPDLKTSPLLLQFLGVLITPGVETTVETSVMQEDGTEDEDEGETTTEESSTTKSPPDVLISEEEEDKAEQKPAAKEEKVAEKAVVKEEVTSPATEEANVSKKLDRNDTFLQSIDAGPQENMIVNVSKSVSSDEPDVEMKRMMAIPRIQTTLNAAEEDISRCEYIAQIDFAVRQLFHSLLETLPQARQNMLCFCFVLPDAEVMYEGLRGTIHTPVICRVAFENSILSIFSLPEDISQFHVIVCKTFYSSIPQFSKIRNLLTSRGVPEDNISFAAFQCSRSVIKYARDSNFNISLFYVQEVQHSKCAIHDRYFGVQTLYK